MSSSRVAQEEEMKREHRSGLQGVQPGKEGEGRWGGQLSSFVGLTSHVWGRVESREEGANCFPSRV